MRKKYFFLLTVINRNRNIFVQKTQKINSRKETFFNANLGWNHPYTIIDIFLDSNIEIDEENEGREDQKNPSNSINLNEDNPDIELVLGLGALTGDMSGTMRNLFGLSEEFYQQFFKEYEGTDAFSIVPVLLNPKSRGRVMLRNSNPFQGPIVEANYFQEKDDLDTMVRGIKEVSEFH